MNVNNALGEYTTFHILFTSAVVIVALIEVVAYKRRKFIVVFGTDDESIVPKGSNSIEYTTTISMIMTWREKIQLN